MVSLAMVSALLLPLNLLSIQRFHHDEALYATWALTIASGQDIWLDDTPIDKPPLFLYLLAGSFKLLGHSETAARLPSLLATALTVGLTFFLGRRLFSMPVGTVAAWLVALSPFSLMFAPTAFTDPVQVAFVIASCLAASYGRAGWAGVLLALAIATKQQGLFFAPLVLGLLFGAGRGEVVSQPQTLNLAESRLTKNPPSKPVFRFTVASLASLVPLLAWDLNRHQPSAFLERSLTNYGGLATDLASIGERGLGFMELLSYATGSVVLNSIFIAGLPLVLIYDLWAGRTKEQSPSLATFPAPFMFPNFQTSKLPIFSPSLLLTLFTLLFLALHAALSFQIWDRYLLGLMPLLALLLARILLLPGSLLQHFHPLSCRRGAGFIYGLGLAGLLAVSLGRPVQDAVNARYPLGSNSEDIYGIEQIVAYLQRNVGANNTLFHHWLGAHWRFYLWDYPYDLQFWDKPEVLASKAKPGYFVAVPARRSDLLLRLVLKDRNYYLREVARAYQRDGLPSLLLYRIEQTDDEEPPQKSTFGQKN